MDAASSQFSALLANATRTRNLSDATLSAEMGARGTYLSTGTIGAWKSGQSLPFHDSWLPILAQLDSLLGLEPDTLAAALDTDTANSQPPSLAVPPARSYAASHRHFIVLNDFLDWSNEAERRTIEDSFTISADFRDIGQRTAIMARQPDYNRATLHLSTHFDQNEKPGRNELALHDIVGADVAEILTQETEDGVSTTTKLLLPSGKPGDLHVVQYTQGARTGSPLPAVPGRVFSWPLLRYTCAVAFEGDVPEEILWNVWIADEHDDTGDGTHSRPLVPDGHAVHAAIDNPYNVVTGISWSLER